MRGWIELRLLSTTISLWEMNLGATLKDKLVMHTFELLYWCQAENGNEILISVDE